MNKPPRKLPGNFVPMGSGSIERAEADLRQQWRNFDTVLSHTADFNYIFDLDGRFTYINRALLALWSKSLEEAVGKNFFDLEYPDELAARLQRQIQEVIATKEPLRDKTPYTGANGEQGFYEYIFVPVFGEGGDVEAVAGSTRDITEHVRLTQAIADSEKKLQRVFSQAPMPILVLRGRDFVVELANDPYLGLIQGRELVGRPFFEVVPEVGQDVRDAFSRVLETGEPFAANEWLIPYDADHDGVIEDHWFNVVYNPLRELDGGVSGFVAVLADVTPQVSARKEVERVNRQLEEFAYIASHDLQEPLRMVNIYTQLLMRRFGDHAPEAQQYADMIGQGAWRMEALIRDLLMYSRAVQRDELPVGTADLSEALTEALAVAEGSIKESDARVSVSPLPLVRGDAAQLSHVFQNLISNAIKYSKRNVPPEISISSRDVDGRWVVAVSDNGIGFEPEHAERIFGLFKRLHKDEYPGTGVGLAICQRIVERYGGRMWAEGRLGEGSTFHFDLPTAQGSER
jgi:PAS domain S-box-containing protein